MNTQPTQYRNRDRWPVCLHDERNRWKSPCLWAFIEIHCFLVFCVFRVDCNYTDNLENRLWIEKWQKHEYSLIAGWKTNGFVDCSSFNKKYLLVRFINLFRLCTKYISRFYVSFWLEPMIELMIEPISEPIWALKYTIVTIG